MRRLVKVVRNSVSQSHAMANFKSIQMSKMIICWINLFLKHLVIDHFYLYRNLIHFFIINCKGNCKRMCLKCKNFGSY